MDYSQISEHPEGSSPWNTSPRASHHNSFTGTQEAPTTPLASSREFGSESNDEGGQQTGFESPSIRHQQQQSASTHESLPEPAQTVNGSPSVSASQQPQTPNAQQPPPQLTGGIPPTQQQGPPKYQGARQQRPAPQYKLQAKITALERNGKKDPILRFDVHTNLPKFRTTQFRDVRRTHSEFVKLADHLISSNPEAFVPAVPPATTSAGAGTDEDESRVKNSLQKWLNNVCSNEVLMRDDEIIFFVESDFGYSPVVRMKQPATGVRRKVIKQFAPPPDDTPELFDARPIVKQFYLGTMDTGQKVDKIVRSRRALGLAEADLGVKIATMHVQELHPGLANAYRKLGRTIQATGDYHAAQGTAEATTLADPMNYHSNDALIVKETLTNRHILLRDLLSAQSTTRSKLSAADRIKGSSSVRREKVDEAISALEEARSHEQYLGQKCQRVTANLILEKRKWFQRTADDLRVSIREYVLREIEAERRALATLESVRPDIRAIDASGGLSRLGREAHPAVRRSSLASSQGPRGDAWSGVQRRGDALTRSVSTGFGPAGGIPEDAEAGGDGKKTTAAAGTLRKTKEDDDVDRVDAKNAASRLAGSTF